MDVEGTLRISDLSGGSNLAAQDSILVSNGNHIVQLIAAKDIFKNTDKSLVKGTIAAGANVPVNGRIPFTNLDFDLKEEFDTDTYEFTATEAGIYRVDVQVTMGSLSLGVESGVGIYKVNLSNIESMIAEERYLNISIPLLISSVTVNPPTRSTGTLVQLAAGEKIRFKNSGLIVINLLSNISGTFFSIEQVK